MQNITEQIESNQTEIKDLSIYGTFNAFKSISSSEQFTEGAS